ncbi:MAG: fatty-acid oxidation protein subunit alpha [Gammaproteobacteria bacterium]|nr:MAG: fatty-acid oxidation protein subunit alpha [Gammaproteobacteria bacterium]
MPAKDIFHNTVKNALQKDGWTITHDPLSIRFGKVELYVDLGAEKLIAAQKNGEQIAVEIKSFLMDSNITDFHRALGQFMNYLMALEDLQPKRILYLAIPSGIYDDFFMLPFGQKAIEYHQLKLIVYDIKKEVIVKWLN